MRELRRETYRILVAAFRRLEFQVPPPQVVHFSEGQALRYVERNPLQAVIQKLARYVSGLNAIEGLHFNGFFQEQAVIQRTLDELSEDVTYIVLGLQVGLNKTHRKFLDRFWKEEFEDGVPPLDSTVTRYQISRTEIRAWIEAQAGAAPDSFAAKAGRQIQQVYSGYVHAASPHIMEMCAGDPPRFLIGGMKGSSFQQDHENDLWNYSFRGLLAMQTAALAFGDEGLAQSLDTFRDQFERISGTNFKATDTDDR